MVCSPYSWGEDKIPCEDNENEIRIHFFHTVYESNGISNILKFYNESIAEATRLVRMAGIRTQTTE